MTDTSSALDKPNAPINSHDVERVSIALKPNQQQIARLMHTMNVTNPSMVKKWWGAIMSVRRLGDDTS